MTLLVRHTDVLGGYDPAARGGGIVGGWNPLNQFLGWRVYTIANVYTDPDGIELPALRLVLASGPQTDTIHQNVARTSRYFVDRQWPYGNSDIRGSFPELAWYFMDPATLAFVAGPLLPLGNSQANPFSFFDPAVSSTQRTTEHYVQWFEHTPPTGPYIGVQVARQPSETFPVWVSGHPVEILVERLVQAGESYDAASAAAVQASLGPELQHIMAVTSTEETVQQLADRFSEAYGFALRRSGATGAVEFVHWAQKLSTLPVPVLDDNTLREDGGPTFNIDETTRITRVKVVGQAVVPWQPGFTMEQVDEPRRLLGIRIGTRTRWKRVPALLDPQKPAAGLLVETGEVTFEYSTDGTTPDSDTYGEQEAEIELGGMPGILDTVSGGAQPILLEHWGEGRARLLFDGHARGRVHATVVTRRGTDADSALLGEAVTLDVSHSPNAQLGQSPTSQRGGQRPFRVIERTEEPPGPVLVLADEGTGVQYATVPDFTVTNDPVTGQSVVTVNNAGDLTTDGAQVEWQVRVFGPAATVDLTDPGLRYWIDDATTWPDDPMILRPGPFPPGHTVFLRARAFLFGGSASDWSDWNGVGGPQTPGTTLSNLIISGIGSDRATLSWSYDESPQVGQVKIEYREVGAGSFTSFDVLAPGTETDLLFPLDAAQGYDVRVVLIDGGAMEYGDVLTGTFTTLGGVLQNISFTSITDTSTKVLWDNYHTTYLVRVEQRNTGATLWFTVAELPPTSNRTRLLNLIPGTDYDVGLSLIDPVTKVSIGDGAGQARLVGMFTTTGGAPQMNPPTNPQIFSGSNPDNSAPVPGQVGLRVQASFASPNPPNHWIMFQVATETSEGSGTPGTYITQQPVAAVVGGLTYWYGAFPNDGRLRYLRAFSRDPGGGATDSNPTTALSADPWPTAPLPPIGGTLNDLVLIDGGSLAEDAHGTGSVSFPDGAKLYLVDSPDLESFRLRLYTTTSARTADLNRLRTETSIAAISGYISPDELLLDVEVTASINYQRSIIGDVRILSNVIGSTTVYFTITRYEPGTGSTRAQVYWTLPTTTGPAS